MLGNRKEEWSLLRLRVLLMYAGVQNASGVKLWRGKPTGYRKKRVSTCKQRKSAGPPCSHIMEQTKNHCHCPVGNHATMIVAGTIYTPWAATVNNRWWSPQAAVRIKASTSGASRSCRLQTCNSCISLRICCSERLLLLLLLLNERLL